MNRRRARSVALWLMGALWIGVFIPVWVRVERYQWDFKTYYYASRALDQGLNPYDTEVLARVAGDDIRPLRFVYPLSTLRVFKPLTRFDYASAHRIWLLLKAATIAGLLLVWKRAFLRDTDWVWILVVGLFAFQATTLWDIKAGNVSSIEQLLLWSGFAALMRGRPLVFALLVVGAAMFKLALSAFLLLLLVPALRRRWSIALVAASLLVIAATTIGSFAGHPDYMRQFVAAAADTPTRLRSNPSVFGAAVELGREYPAVFGVAPAPYLLWLVFSAGVLFAGRRVIALAWRSSSPRLAILVGCFCYALVVPRFMVYSYMILIVPVLALILAAARNVGGAVYAVAGLVCLGGLEILPATIGTWFVECEPLVLMIGCWWFLIVANSRGLLIERTANRHGTPASN